MKETYWTLGCPCCETGLLYSDDGMGRTIAIFPNKELAQLEASSIQGEIVPVVQITVERIN